MDEVLQVEWGFRALSRGQNCPSLSLPNDCVNTVKKLKPIRYGNEFPAFLRLSSAVRFDEKIKNKRRKSHLMYVKEIRIHKIAI